MLKQIPIAVLCSGGGTNLQAILDAEAAGKIPSGHVALVVSDNAGAFALERAKRAGVETAVFDKKSIPDRKQREEAILSFLQEKGIASNFVLLDRGYTRINVKLNGIVMTMVNGMGPKIPEKKVDELLARMDVVGAGDTLVLTGSIRDDGPLPEVIGNAYEGQTAMRNMVKKSTTVVCLATMLHTIATGNMTPSYRVLDDGTVRPVFLYTVDADEFVVNKLLDRGSLAATTIVTNVQDFIMIVVKGLGLM